MKSAWMTAPSVLLTLGAAVLFASPVQSQSRGERKSKPAADAPARTPAPRARSAADGSRSTPQTPSGARQPAPTPAGAGSRGDAARTPEARSAAAADFVRQVAIGRRMRERRAEREHAGDDQAEAAILIGAEEIAAARAVYAHAREQALPIVARFDNGENRGMTPRELLAWKESELVLLRPIHWRAKTELDVIACRVLDKLSPDQIAILGRRIARQGFEPTRERMLGRIGFLLELIRSGPFVVKPQGPPSAGAPPPGEARATPTQRRADRARE